MAERTDRIQVLVVEATWWWREAFLRVLEHCDDGVEAAAAFGVEEVERAVSRRRPDVAIVDLDAPGGSELLRELCDVRDIPCLAVASEPTAAAVSAALAVTATFAVKQELDPERLCRLVSIVRTGDALLLRTTRRLLGELLARGWQSSAERYGLTVREAEVVALLGEGLSNAEIAARLHLSDGHVKKLVSRAFQRLGVRNRTEAALVARREGIVRAPPATELPEVERA